MCSVNNEYGYLRELPAPHAWMEKAACTGIFTELFFYTSGPGHTESDVTAALAICRTCPVINQCLKFAFDTGDRFAVLGGTTPAQRRVMLGRKTA